MVTCLKIEDSYRKRVTAILLENQEKVIMETTNAVGGGMSPVVGGEGNIKGYDPILISLVRRALPNLIAYDICGVQPLTGPTGLIFAMKSRYDGQTGDEALYNEARTSFSGNTGAEHGNNQAGGATALNANSGAVDPLLHEGITSAGGAGGAAGGTGNFGNQFGGATIGAEYGVNFGMSTTDAEQLGADSFLKWHLALTVRPSLLRPVR